MAKIKLSEVADELAYATDNQRKEVVAKAKEMGLKVVNITSSITEEQAALLADFLTSGVNPNPPAEKKPAKKTSKKSESASENSVDSESKAETKTAKTTKKVAKKDAEKEAKASEKAKKSTKTSQKREPKISESSGLDSQISESGAPKASKKATKKDEPKLNSGLNSELDSEKLVQTAPQSAQKASEKISESKVLDSETEPQTQASVSESNAQTAPKPAEQNDNVTISTSGFRIVRKNKPDEPKKDEPKANVKAKKSSKMMDYKDILAQTEGENKSNKKKVQIKNRPAKKHNDNEQRLDFEREITFEREDEENNEIMLFDLNESNFKDEDEENKIRAATIERVGVQRKNPWMSEGSIKRGGKKFKKYNKVAEQKVLQSTITIPEEVRVYEFAELSGRELKDVIKVLFNLGVMATKNDFLDKDSIEILAEEFEIKVNILEEKSEFENLASQSTTDSENLTTRAPVVTIMGHVDHGKTSLLDYIRNSRVAAKEAGGITQHIGAYMVEKNGKKISFIDTPGHEAFTSMRARGAQVTDIAIIVIAADDGVKPQSIEALKQAKAAGVQIIIAMNKMDKENVNVDKLKADCAELGFTPNDWGGEYEFIGISAKTGLGVDDLLETILLQAEVLELKANFEGRASGVVLEGSLEKGRGAVASIIVQNGTLKVGDSVVAGTAYGKVRAMNDDLMRPIKELTPSSVAQIVGLSEVPEAGAAIMVVESDAVARDTAQKRALYLRQKELSKSTKVTLEELGDMVAVGKLNVLPIVLKADTQGSLEAIKNSLNALSNDEVKVNIISSSVGGISESDIDLASASKNCVILGFNVRPTGNVKARAKELGVQIQTYSVIYALIDEIKALISGLMSPVMKEENTGQAQVRETFAIPKVGVVAGCMVVDGSIQRGGKVRLIRDGVVVHTGQIASLKRFKDDAKEVAKGYECGIMLENFNDVRVGDVFETFKEIATAAQI